MEKATPITRTVNQMADWYCYGSLVTFKSVLSQHADALLYRKPSFKSSVMVSRGPADPWTVCILIIQQKIVKIVKLVVGVGTRKR